MSDATPSVGGKRRISKEEALDLAARAWIEAERLNPNPTATKETQ